MKAPKPTYAKIVNIIELRAVMGVSQKRFAELLGVSRGTVSRLENGAVFPSIDTCMRLKALAAQPGINVQLDTSILRPEYRDLFTPVDF